MSLPKNKLLIWFMALVVILACVPSLNAAPAVPTLDPGAINTSIALTVNAASTQTAAAIPSLTPTATFTPTPTSTETEEPTATNTVIFILKSPTPFVVATNTSIGGGSTSSNKDYACDIISISPANGTVYDPRTDFDAKWRVKNIGKKAWERNSADYIYESGDKFHKVSGYDFTQTVDVGETVDLIVDMLAPKNSGTYTTYWTIRIGSQKFCKMGLTIAVR